MLKLLNSHFKSFFVIIHSLASFLYFDVPFLAHISAKKIKSFSSADKCRSDTSLLISDTLNSFFPSSLRTNPYSESSNSLATNLILRPDSLIFFLKSGVSITLISFRVPYMTHHHLTLLSHKVNIYFDLFQFLLFFMAHSL